MAKKKSTKPEEKPTPPAEQPQDEQAVKIATFSPPLRVFEVIVDTKVAASNPVRKVAAHEVVIMDGNTCVFSDYVVMRELGRIALQTKHMLANVVEMKEITPEGIVSDRVM